MMKYNENKKPYKAMIKTSQLFTLGAALLAGAVLTTHAQTWTNVYDPSHGGVPGVSGDISTDAAGNVYAAGRYIATSGSSVAIVQCSTNQGANWQVLDQYAEPGLSYAHNRAFAAAPAEAPLGVRGHLFAGGNLNNLLANGTYEYDALWFIREWNPQSGTWTNAEDSLDLANDVGQASCADIMVTPSGDVYTTGGSQLGWLVRKRPAVASSFATVDADYTGQSSGSGWDMAYHPSYGVFVVGEVNGIWTVRRSSSGKLGSWQTKDSFTVPRQWGGGRAYCILVTRSGDIYVTGSVYSQKTYSNHWVVRRSTDGGETWAIVDDLLPGHNLAEAFGIVEDASGRLLVCGRVDGTAGDMHWIVRRWQQVEKTSKQKGKTVTTLVWEWTTIDDYQVKAGKNSRANAITTDAQGNIYVSGNGLDANGVDQFIVRKLPAAQ
jgi:hypothetical protein